MRYMKKIFDYFQKINKKIFVISLLIILVFLIIKVIILIPIGNSNSEIPFNIQSIEYIEDDAGMLSLEDVQSKEYDGRFLHKEGNTLSIGQSRSIWWIRMKLNDSLMKSNGLYLSINNPTVEKAILYIPVNSRGEVLYKALCSGWGFFGETQDEGYTYPVFKFDNSIDTDKYIYLQLSSPFTQNYNLQLMQDKELNNVRLNAILIVGIFFGLLLALGINNFINFLSLKDHVQLFYVMYILSMLCYQGALLGIYRIFMGPAAEAFISNVVALGLFVVACAIMFFRSFLITANKFPKQDKYLKAMLILCLVGIVLVASNFRYEASIFSTVLAASVILLIIYISVVAVHKGIDQSKFFLAGWCTMLLSYVIFTARVWGMLPNNELTLFIVLMSAVIEAILLSLALANRVRALREEKERVLVLFKNAEETSISNESAFLQAQIKPHFIYNTLNVIAALCRIDAEKARQLILDLSCYLHNSIHFSNLTKYITFDEELEFIKAYVRIEQARFKDKLKIVYELEDTKELQIPPLMLQPLVENAVRHGIRKSDIGGIVIIRVKNQEDSFLIEVEDDGAGMSAEQINRVLSENWSTGNGIGLANIQKRLLMLYRTQLTVKSNIGKGTKITLILPKRKENV